MKKIIHKVREHAHILDHHHHQQPQQHDETLKTSPYEDTALRTPPTVGERPLGSNMDPEPPRARRKTLTGPGPIGDAAGVLDRPTAPAPAPAPAPVPAPATDDAPKAFPSQPGQPPTNFSRLPPRKADSPSTAAYKSAGEPPISHERHQRSVTPSPSAIQPQDLADPEYSYLSRVYPMSPTNRDDPTRRRRSVSAAQPQTAGMPDTSRRQLYLSAAPTHGSPDTSPLSPTIPRKEVGSGITTGLHLNKASLESARAGTTDYAAHEPSAGSPPQALAEAAGRSVPVIDLGTTVDTEVITKEAAAVLHETIVPKVHEIREEIITRDIHKHYIIHRVLPVIDVEVLPPRHFVPAADGTLVEVSADQIPGRLGHWGIVETVTKPPGASRQSEPLPFMPVAGGAPTTISTTTTTIVHTEHGAYPRTETVIRHPPTLSTAARDAGESWPMLIDPQHYAEKHGLPVTAAPIAQGTMKPLPRVGDASAAPAASTSSYPATVPTANLATAGPLLPNPGADILPRFRDYASPAIPGAFPPPVSSTAAYNTFPEPPSHPPPPPPKD